MVRGKSVGEPQGYLVGYARVSTEDQSLGLQVEALRRAGVDEDRIHVETASGAGVKKRPRLRNALKDLAEGDTLVVWKLDRLTRYMPDLYWYSLSYSARALASAASQNTLIRRRLLAGWE